MAPDRDPQSTIGAAPAPPIPPPPPGDGPRHLDITSRYRVLRQHARGGLGEILIALDEGVNREVAVKQILPPLADDADARRRFALEAEVTAQLEHPGVVPVYGLGRGAGGEPVYAMRFIRGETLSKAIADFHDPESRPRSPRERSRRLRQLLSRFVAVCNAIAYAHSKGVVHRDLKPENVMLGPFGETLVVDWGLAKQVPGGAAGTAGGADTPPSQISHLKSESSHLTSETGEPQSTRAGSVIGTPAYMSPEQALASPDVGPASDVYSLGATLYCLLTGRPPFAGSVPQILAAVVAGDYPPPRRVNRAAPSPLSAVCRRAMTRAPGDRYATALELAADVERWLADEPVTAYREPLLTRLGRWSRRHLIGVTVVGGAALLALILLPPLLLLFRGLDVPRAALDRDPGPGGGRIIFQGDPPPGGVPGEPDPVMQALAEAIQRDPKHAEAYLERARLLLTAGKIDDALTDLAKVEEVAPKHPDLAAVRGGARLAKGELDGAKADLDRALAEGRRSAEALRHRASLHLQRGELKEALADADALVRLAPASARAYRLRADVHEARGDADAAAEDADRAKRLDFLP